MADEARPAGGSPYSKSAWAATSLRSGFGSQPLSNRASAPAAGFGSSSRDAYNRQYASAEVDRAQVCAREWWEVKGRAWTALPTSRHAGRRVGCTLRLNRRPTAPPARRRRARWATSRATWAPATRWGASDPAALGSPLLARLCKRARLTAPPPCLPSTHPLPWQVPDTISKQVLSTVASPPRVRFGEAPARCPCEPCARICRGGCGRLTAAACPLPHRPTRRHQQARGAGGEERGAGAGRLQGQARAGCAAAGVEGGGVGRGACLRRRP